MKKWSIAAAEWIETLREKGRVITFPDRREDIEDHIDLFIDGVPVDRKDHFNGGRLDYEWGELQAVYHFDEGTRQLTLNRIGSLFGQQEWFARGEFDGTLWIRRTELLELVLTNIRADWRENVPVLMGKDAPYYLPFTRLNTELNAPYPNRDDIVVKVPRRDVLGLRSTRKNLTGTVPWE